MNGKTIALGGMLAVAACFSTPVHATPEDQLAACLVSHTSPADRTALVKWIFAQFALSPEVAPMARITDAERGEMNAQTGKLFMRLLTNDCPSEAHLAYQVDGSAAIQSSFQILGQVAARGLMSDSNVQAGMSGFTKDLDEAKLRSTLGIMQPPSSAAGKPPR